MEDSDHDDDEDDGLLKSWTEFWGRHKQLLPPEFAENEIIAGPYPFNTSIFGTGFMHAFPQLDAILVTPDGESRLLGGGYTKLPSGTYKIYYVDRHERHTTLPDIKATTSDGAEVTISLEIIYQVTDSITIQKIRDPLDALVKGCKSTIRRIIHNHKHDDIFAERPDDPGLLPDSQISDEVLLQVSLIEACRAFDLKTVIILHRQGDPALLGLREKQAYDTRTATGVINNTNMKKHIVDEQKELFKGQKELEIERLNLFIMAEKLKIELVNLRNSPQYQHAENMAKIDGSIKSLEAYIKSLSQPGFIRSQEELHVAYQFIQALRDPSGIPAETQPPVQENEPEDKDSFIQLMIPKKK